MIWKRAAFGETIHANGVILTPQSETIGLDFPFGGLVWNRPVAILVEKDDVVKRIPIVDITRMAVLLLAGLTLAFSVIGVTKVRQRREGEDE